LQLTTDFCQIRLVDLSSTGSFWLVLLTVSCQAHTLDMIAYLLVPRRDDDISLSVIWHFAKKIPIQPKVSLAN